MQVTVAYVNPPKPGKKFASIKDTTGQYHGYDPAKFTFEKGRSYDVTVEESEYQGKTYSNITAVKAGASGVSGDRWWLPFVSNQVAHAIAAGKITEPEEMKLWGAAAKQCIIEVDAPDDEPDF